MRRIKKQLKGRGKDQIKRLTMRTERKEMELLQKNSSQINDVK